MPLVFVCVIPHSKSNYLFLFVGSFKTIDFGLPTNTRQSVVRIQSNSCQMLFLIILMPLVSVCLIPRSKSMYISVCGDTFKSIDFWFAYTYSCNGKQAQYYVYSPSALAAILILV